MTEPASALNRFFSGFGLPAYARNDVPDGAAPPYITYELAVPPPMGETGLRAWAWYPGPELAGALAKAGEVMDALDPGGAVLGFDGGRLWLLPGVMREDGPAAGGLRSVEMRLRLARLG